MARQALTIDKAIVKGIKRGKKKEFYGYYTGKKPWILLSMCTKRKRRRHSKYMKYFLHQNYKPSDKGISNC